MSMAEVIVVDDAGALAAGGGADAVVVVGPGPIATGVTAIDGALEAARKVDGAVDRELGLLPAAELAGGRLVVSPVRSVNREGDDARRFGEAARAGVQRAARAGARRPVLVVCGAPESEIFARALEVAALEASGSSWAPLEAREARGESSTELVDAVLVWTADGAAELGARLSGVEWGRRAARDVTGTEPERMAPIRMADYCKKLFEGTAVSVEVVDERSTLERDYPLLSAVGRASWSVARHHPRVIRLAYEGEGETKSTLLFAGKGVVYDTGGADLKVGGAMAGMSRDKGGAGAVVGFFAALSKLRPAGVRCVAEIGAVRNSIGSDCFVTDEIITSHAGVRVRIGNTDAEGRLVLADLLSHLRKQAETAVRPHMFTIATLTGHVGRAYGPYTAMLDNTAARAQRSAERLAEAGEVWGEPVEISRIRREDFELVRPRTGADDVLSSNNAPSTATARGHQFPAAFLQIASGLVDHGTGQPARIAYTHIDIGGSAVEGGDWQHGRPTGAPVAALLAGLGLLD